MGALSAIGASLTILVLNWKSIFHRQNFRRAGQVLSLILSFQVFLLVVLGARTSGLESLLVKFGSDHLGYVQGTWWLLHGSSDVAEQSPNQNLLEMKASVLMPGDDRLLTYAFGAAASFIGGLDWQWSYFITALVVFGMTGALLVTSSRRLLVKLLIFLAFCMSQSLDLAVMGYQGKSVFWLLTLVLLIAFTRLSKINAIFFAFFGSILGSAYGGSSSLLIFLLLSLASIASLLNFNSLSSIWEGLKFSARNIALLVFFQFIATGWLRTFHKPYDLQRVGMAETGISNRMQLIGNLWDISWWGSASDLSIIGLVVVSTLITGALGLAIWSRGQKKHESLVILNFTLFATLAAIVIPSEWVVYQMASLGAISFLLAIGTFDREMSK
jgi:hypothetical protein